ncbi:MAG: LemA family protein [Candidatus Altiarchaeota archaeon]|nr:LemA family protein [Candidatus Altiarchaeota archaeon]
MIGWIIGGVISVSILVFFIGVFNKFVGLRNGIDNTFNQIKVAMKKRADMIGQLVDTTSSYLKFEKSTLKEVTKMRKMSMDNVSSLNDADAAARSVFGNIVAVAENYPNLKAVQTVKPLQDGITSLEGEISRMRYLYNDQVQTFNNMAERIPTNMVAGVLGYKKKEYLQFEKGIEKRPDTKVF